jgi:aconitate hydratase
MKKSFRACLTAPVAQRGYSLPEENFASSTTVSCDGADYQLRHGSVVIAAITSCTNTSNPSVMLGAGLLAKKAIERGLRTPPYVKTSLAPGSRVVTDYLQESGLSAYLNQLGFNVVGYGCTTCIGNSGPLPERVHNGLKERPLVVAAVLSGNRNFEGRIHSQVKANYLASPLLVVAYALAGTVDVDMMSEPLGHDPQGQPVYLRDVWPSQEEVRDAVHRFVHSEMFRSNYNGVWEGNSVWNAIPVSGGELYGWREDSTYIQEPPYFADSNLKKTGDIRSARILALFGDSVTTDHISPAGEIAVDSPAGRYLVERGANKLSFNTYGARRGNDRVMVRGTFANIRLKNLLVGGVEGNATIHFPSGDRMAIFEAAMRYKAEGVPLVVVAGKEYGSGSSRDWAAKGPLLQGVRAVLVESFERIHRSNLAGMGVLPLQFLPGESAVSLGLLGDEVIDIQGLENQLKPKQEVEITATPFGRSPIRFKAISRLDSAVEVDYYLNGGILQTVLKNLMQSDSAATEK